MADEDKVQDGDEEDTHNSTKTTQYCKGKGNTTLYTVIKSYLNFYSWFFHLKKLVNKNTKINSSRKKIVWP